MLNEAYNFALNLPEAAWDNSIVIVIVIEIVKKSARMSAK